ncbi:hypothetical protein VNO80_09996 [Phaseolus coccineus]|uniref:Uncharacterized protein n=1 Tax=Phaseolus coccineus TaxID=3886 RepID=A0AAN9N7M2_PHACN
MLNDVTCSTLTGPCCHTASLPHCWSSAPLVLRSTAAGCRSVTRQDSLVEQTTQETFNPYGREDILNVVGYGVGILSYFGLSSHSKEHSFSQPNQKYLLRMLVG